MIQSSHPGGWLLNRPLLITGKSARCYFAVPAGVKDFDIQIAGRLNLPVKASLLNPEGKTAASSDRIEEPCRLRGKASGRKREIGNWRNCNPARDWKTSFLSVHCHIIQAKNKKFRNLPSIRVNIPAMRTEKRIEVREITLG